MGGMLRPRRRVVPDRIFYVTCRVLAGLGALSVLEFACWARVIRERRARGSRVAKRGEAGTGDVPSPSRPCPPTGGRTCEKMRY
jgi:hypothetical protein